MIQIGTTRRVPVGILKGTAIVSQNIPISTRQLQSYLLGTTSNFQPSRIRHQQQQQQQYRCIFDSLPYNNNSNSNGTSIINSNSNSSYSTTPTLHSDPQQLQQQLQQQQQQQRPNKVWDKEAVADLFAQYAKNYDGRMCLNCDDIRNLLRGIGVVPIDTTITKLFDVADNDHNGLIDMEEFMDHADMFLGDNPARIILIVGGPGSGKGLLSKRLMAECNVVHLSSGDLLRQEVALETNLGKTVRDIMSRGELVSSAIMVALMKKRMKDHFGKRILLDGFPRSIENAHDLVTLCGTPELALHLNCDDTILMERIMGRGVQSSSASSSNNSNTTTDKNTTNTIDPSKTATTTRREDDNFYSALQRLRTFHKYHHSTMEWLREQHVPIVNLDCSGSAESVWQQLLAIGRLMRPAVKLPTTISSTSNVNSTGTHTPPINNNSK